MTNEQITLDSAYRADRSLTAIPTPDEYAAMSSEEREAAYALFDFSAMAEDEARAYARAAMTPPRIDRPYMQPHIRQRIARKRGNTFYKVTYGPNENGSKTLCGAEAGLDFTWGEGGRVRDGQDVCPECKTIRDRARNGA